MSEQVLKEQKVEETASDWGGLPVKEMLDEGFYLYKRKKGANSYMCLRSGNMERSLGPFHQDKWDLFLEEFPDAMPVKASRGKSILGTNIRKPKALGSRYEPSVEVLDWFFWFQERGFAGKLDEFLNQIVHDYFVGQGLSLAVVIREN